MIKAYRIMSWIVTLILYMLAIFGLIESFLMGEKMDYGYTDILITILILFISTLTLVFTIRTRKIKFYRISQAQLIDDIADVNADLPVIKNFKFLSISNLIIGMLYPLFFIIVIIVVFTQSNDFMYIDFTNFEDIILPFLLNILVAFYGFLQINYVLKIRKMYHLIKRDATT